MLILVAAKIMPLDDKLQERRSDYDVTNNVQVTSTAAVRTAVQEVFGELYPMRSFDPLWLAFHDFERFFWGLDPEYFGVDTTYHDVQHTLDMTLALVRLAAGHEATAEPKDRLGPERASLALITALFHDSGYLRHRENDLDHRSGAEFTLSHVSRSARFIDRYLPRIGLEDFSAVAGQVVHYTGYEVDLDRIELDDPRDTVVGHLLGTADLIAQLSDRCYLEKCRDRLFPEFVLGGIAIEKGKNDTGALVRYRSGQDLLAKTLTFYQRSAHQRLDRTFNKSYRYVEALFEGQNPYVIFIQKNLAYLRKVQASQDWGKLRRHPPCTVPDPSGEARMTALAVQHIRELARAQQIVLKDRRVLEPALSY